MNKKIITASLLLVFSALSTSAIADAFEPPEGFVDQRSKYHKIFAAKNKDKGQDNSLASGIRDTRSTSEWDRRVARNKAAKAAAAK